MAERPNLNSKEHLKKPSFLIELAGIPFFHKWEVSDGIGDLFGPPLGFQAKINSMFSVNTLSNVFSVGGPEILRAANTAQRFFQENKIYRGNDPSRPPKKIDLLVGGCFDLLAMVLMSENIGLIDLPTSRRLARDILEMLKEENLIIQTIIDPKAIMRLSPSWRYRGPFSPRKPFLLKKYELWQKFNQTAELVATVFKNLLPPIITVDLRTQTRGVKKPQELEALYFENVALQISLLFPEFSELRDKILVRSDAVSVPSINPSRFRS